VEEEKKSSSPTSQHWLKSSKAGDSEIEQIAERCETRRANRILVTHDVQVRLLQGCRAIAKSKGYEKSRIYLSDLVAYRESVAKEAEEAKKNPIKIFLRANGFFIESITLLQVLDRALEVVREVQMDDDDWFHYQDFSFYHTKVVSTWPWMRSETRVAVFIVFAYYFFTPILFCHIVDEGGICVEVEGKPYAGWMSSLYFASTTLSTVGYGDLTVEKDTRWRTFIGVAYMILSVGVAVVAFSAAADNAFTPLGDLWTKVSNYLIGEPDPDAFLYQRIRRIKFVRLGQIFFQFLALNLLGTVVSRAFVPFTVDGEEFDWTWMTSLYLAVQTTTTIGYGDLVQPFDMRWFQIFYLTLSTYFVGSALGQLGSLKSEIRDITQYYSWESRPVSKRFLDEVQAEEHDDKVDQYGKLLSVVVMSLYIGQLASSLCFDAHTFTSSGRIRCGIFDNLGKDLFGRRTPYYEQVPSLGRNQRIYLCGRGHDGPPN